MADLFTLYGRIAINADEANRQIGRISGEAGGLKNNFEGIGKAAVNLGRKIKTALVAAGAVKALKAVSDLGKRSIAAYADYEQLVGGVD